MLKSKQIILILMLVSLLSDVWSFGKRRIRKSKENKIDICENKIDEFQDSNTTIVDPYCDCASAGIVQKIPYIQIPSKDSLTEEYFSSACIKCGMCLAIANQINDTLLEIHESMDVWLNDTEAVFLLRNICDFAFKHYGLREHDGKRFICGNIPSATLVTSSIDGLWEKHLKYSCHEYLDEINPLVLYHYWQQWCHSEYEGQTLVKILCRNEVGKLRHCRRMDDMVTYEPPKNFQTNLKIKVEFGC